MKDLKDYLYILAILSAMFGWQITRDKFNIRRVLILVVLLYFMVSSGMAAYLTARKLSDLTEILPSYQQHICKEGFYTEILPSYQQHICKEGFYKQQIENFLKEHKRVRKYFKKQ